MRTFVLLVALIVAGPVLAAEEESADGQSPSRQFGERFMSTLAEGRTYDAFGLMQAATSASDGSVDDMRNDAQQLLDQVRGAYGKPVGYELLHDQPLGNSLIRQESLLKLERFPLRCVILFYKPADKWIPVRVWLDEDIAALFEEVQPRAYPIR